MPELAEPAASVEQFDCRTCEAPADGYDMTMTAAVLDHGGADVAVLVAACH
ncbi:hypothetical protein [Streptomyces sp. NPDC057582]|uniref:hypothetical protein n=1 Tax=unclassified Streptomyces TaxID=2593676 RepID=UPI0036AF9443